jgi:uncharacterized protein YbjT (DUF2867 family)
MRVFLAGATGVLGRRIVPLLVARGHQVTALTRAADGAGRLRYPSWRDGFASFQALPQEAAAWLDGPDKV